MGGLRRFGGNRRGSTAVEFALVVAPLVALMLGTFEFGRLLWTKQGLEETARETARCMGVLQTPCAVADTYDGTRTREFALRSSRKWGVSLPQTAVAIDRAASCNALEGFSRVTIRYTFDSPLPGFVQLIGDARNLRADACFPNQV